MFSVPFPKKDALGTCVSSNQVQMSGTSKVVECTICRKSFACLRYVVKHMARVHSKEKEDKKPLECSICSKSFPRLSHLQRHQLIHIKDREWGCPFCEQSFVQKAHLMRHIGRWHASQYRDGLEERIAANKWRSKGKPIDPLEKLETNAPSTQQCSDLLSRLLCTQCGMTFDNRTDLDRHHTNTHRPLKCKHCGEVFDGYGNLRAHELRQRAQSFECSCGASFSRPSELRIHRDSCRKRGSFLCIVCDRLFTQRVQLDRHWKKEHFVSAQCAECGWIAAAPLRKAEHALEVHKKDICGYCGMGKPSSDHLSLVHWKRLKKSIPIGKLCEKQDRPSDTESCNLPVEFKSTSPSFEECRNSDNSGDQKSHVVLPSQKELFVDCSGTSSIASGSGSEANNSVESALDREHEKSHGASIDLPKAAPVREEAYLNVVLSIPNHVVDDFYFGDRLPDEIRKLFPELTHARVCIVEPFVGQKRFLSLHIPVIRPPETSGQADRLLSVPIYV